MTVEDSLAFRLNEDKIWRIRELSEIIRACKDATGIQRDALTRAAIPVSYAHWEGYFVFSTNAYLNFIASKRIMLTKLRREFWALSIRRRYKAQQLSGDILFNRFLIDIRVEEDRAFRKGNYEKINGASNLRSDVLKWCCEQIGIDAELFAEYFEFIDHKLVERRNFIAHGQSTRVDFETISEYRDKVVEMMRITEGALENAIYTESYLA